MRSTTVTIATQDNTLPGSLAVARPNQAAVIVNGEGLTIGEVVRVSRHGAPVRLTDDPQVLQRINAAADYVTQAVTRNEPIYGVTTGFGGMSAVVIDKEETAALQDNLIRLHKTGAGRRLPGADVRAAMLLRMNSHARGASGLRLELIRRLELFLNAAVTPHVPELGSIGASGDLVPLTYITGSLIGLDNAFKVDFNGEEMDAPLALRRLGLKPMSLRPKEGLAMINGTSVSTAIAAHCVYDAQVLLATAMGAHALTIQALCGTDQSFHGFIHAHKPHPGQQWAAAEMLRLLKGAALVRNELNGAHAHRGDSPIQDRYSLRCLPQYIGPIVEGIRQITRQIEVEMNSASDNPLIDVDHQVSYHGGNFLAQYIGVAMDQLRYYLGLTAKHLDVQIALLMAPEFNNRLTPSLIGNTKRKVNMGLKGIQLTGNAIMPLITFLGNSLVDRFPTHAEQFNQNVNSQSYGSANLARQAVELMDQYLAVALITCVQAVDLRAWLVSGSYDARSCLSPETARLYEAVRTLVGKPPAPGRPYIWNDNEQFLDTHIAAIAADLAEGSVIANAVQGTLASLRNDER